MSITRKAVIAAVAALALGGSMVASTAPADAHDYTKEGSVSAKEANKLFKQAFKQKCLTMHEAQHIAHGRGDEESWSDSEGTPVGKLYYLGTKKSHIYSLRVEFEHGCAIDVSAYKS